MTAPSPLLPRDGRTDPTVTPGWRLERVTAPSRLFGANGLRTGPDGRVYVAQVTGSQISALDVSTGELAVISARGGDVVAPDDVAFDSAGTLYATEVMDARVSALDNGAPGCCATTCRVRTGSPCIKTGCSSGSAATAAG
ncbi:hypothetical protein MSEN_40370 [Mycolicibacter senuensis]|uniref:Gluconolaconase n=1 Tax=Mycolicibacter senuensis TaxID=386913 RepID=A0A7I9XSQ4_9MYCO|nr:hypothetical protein MSEN_40370 [Mycolicibacter senuensis]